MPEIRIDPRDFVRINQDFFNRVIMIKQMTMIQLPDEPGVFAAQSNIINDEVFGIKNYQYEQKFRLLYSKKIQGQKDKFRQMEISYKEVVIDMVQNQSRTVDEVIDRMYGALRKMTDKEWEQLSQNAKEVTFTNPQLK